MFAYATILFSGLMASTVLASPLMSNSVCAKDNVVSCCNTSGGDGVLGNVLGGACDIHLLQIANNCPAGNTFCCPVNQDGQLNIALACIPVTL